MEGHIADILKTRGPKLTQIKLEVTVNNAGDRVVSRKIDDLQKIKVIISLAITNDAVRDQIDWVEVVLSKKHRAIFLFCNY